MIAMKDLPLPGDKGVVATDKKSNGAVTTGRDTPRTRSRKN